MKRKIKLFTIIVALLTSASFISCSNDDEEQFSYVEAIVGTWSMYQETTDKGIRDIGTNSMTYQEWTFTADGYLNVYGWKDYNNWGYLNSFTLNYKVEGNNVYITGNGETMLLFEIVSITDDLMKIKRSGTSGYGILKKGSRR